MGPSDVLTHSYLPLQRKCRNEFESGTLTFFLSPPPLHFLSVPVVIHPPPHRHHHHYLANPSAQRRKLLSCAFLNVRGFFVRRLIFCSHPPFTPFIFAIRCSGYYSNNGEARLVRSKDWRGEMKKTGGD